MSVAETTTSASETLDGQVAIIGAGPAGLTAAYKLMEREPRNVYLTHFGRVTEVERLAEDLYASIAQFAEWGQAFDGAEDRRAQIESAMMDWLVEGARAHGVRLTDEELHEVFRNDVELNTQGIECWLDRGRDSTA